MNVEGKVVLSHIVPTAGDRCYYLLNLPKEAIEKDIFYVRPLKNFTVDGPRHHRSSKLRSVV